MIPRIREWWGRSGPKGQATCATAVSVALVLFVGYAPLNVLMPIASVGGIAFVWFCSYKGFSS